MAVGKTSGTGVVTEISASIVLSGGWWFVTDSGGLPSYLKQNGGRKNLEGHSLCDWPGVRIVPRAEPWSKKPRTVLALRLRVEPPSYLKQDGSQKI
ncbi:hypothetical protein EVAR_13640_1 [Eumeta japonica]|uniref:Uncharacterized protein n=1 Tax=Eumeta variegata TaxID=151549 RepID=A0A4C1UUM2_EUMVA|nr:hypothetical protein EVAR_13640_1 [Eumeta japonica]